MAAAKCLYSARSKIRSVITRKNNIWYREKEAAGYFRNLGFLSTVCARTAMAAVGQISRGSAGEGSSEGERE